MPIFLPFIIWCTFFCHAVCVWERKHACFGKEAFALFKRRDMENHFVRLISNSKHLSVQGHRYNRRRGRRLWWWWGTKGWRLRWYARYMCSVHTTYYPYWILLYKQSRYRRDTIHILHFTPLLTDISGQFFSPGTESKWTIVKVDGSIFIRLMMLLR